MARRYEGRLQVLSSPGLDNVSNMARAVRDFGWPGNIIHMPDNDGSLWNHFGVRFRGTWVLINRKGEVVQRTSPHPPNLSEHLQQLLEEHA